MSNFTDFTDQAVTDPVILVEIQPKEQLTGWTALEGSDSVYTRSFDTFVQEDVIAGGLYRTLTKMTEDDTVLTQVDDTNQVTLNPGTWTYTEEGTGVEGILGEMVLGDKLHLNAAVVYLHTLEGDDPDDAVVVYGTFRVHFASTGKVLNSIYYEPRASTRTLPEVHEETEDIFFGEVKKVGSGNVQLHNGDGLFDKLAANWSWKNARLDIYFGGGALTHSAGGNGSYATVANYLIEDFVAAFENAHIMVRDVQRVGFRALPPNLLSTSDYSGLPDTSRGEPIPLLFGDKSGITPVRIFGNGNAGTTTTYLIADNSLQTLYSIDAVYNAGVAIGAGDLVKSTTGCTFSVKASYGTTLSTITCDAIGQPVRGNAWETSTNYLQRYGEIVSEIYTNYLGLANAEINSAAALDVDDSEPVEQAVYMKNQKTARTWVRGFEKGVLGRTIRSADGTIKPTIWLPGADLSVITAITAPDTKSIEPDSSIRSLFSKIIIKYDQDPTDDTWLLVEKSNQVTRFLHLDGREEERPMETFIKNQSDADVLAERIRFLASKPDVNVRLVENGIRLFAEEVGNRIKITLPRAPSSTGQWDEQVMEILKITRRFNPPSVEVLLNNLKGLGGQVGTWTSNSAPLFVVATDDDKSRSGYWLDENSEAIPGDASTRDVSIW
ncbi:MAG: hypothetical protein ACXABY_32835, partial [Candidatus Thorarchaeota archaeon]